MRAVFTPNNVHANVIFIIIIFYNFTHFIKLSVNITYFIEYVFYICSVPMNNTNIITKQQL